VNQISFVSTVRHVLNETLRVVISKDKNRKQPCDSSVVANGKSEVETGTATLRVLRHDFTTMRFHN
jgi:hypothetical protein